eukprot:COSAG01_NODE_3577_length_5914_cov_24.715268_7_plen_99_part_00
MIGMGTKVTGLSAQHRPGGSRRGKLFYAGHGGWLYAPISYHYAIGEFQLERCLQDYDPATDSFTRCLPDQTFGSSGAFTENATWTYSYLLKHTRCLCI